MVRDLQTIDCKSRTNDFFCDQSVTNRRILIGVELITTCYSKITEIPGYNNSNFPYFVVDLIIHIKNRRTHIAIDLYTYMGGGGNLMLKKEHGFFFSIVQSYFKVLDFIDYFALKALVDLPIIILNSKYTSICIRLPE